ncbi:MAG: hypothetical protein KDI07_15850 [Anaerolineae bacterium]|nr:hypothetical protein [Anaerolineae bacterium]
MFAEDLDVFINEATPGYKTLLINYESVGVIFDNNYIEEGFTESAVPVFWAKTAEMPALAHGDPIIDEAGDERYEVVNIQPDGSGITMVRLRRL